MLAIRTFINSLSARSISILLTFVGIGFLMGCTGVIRLTDIVGGVVADGVNGSIAATVTLPVHDTIDLTTDNGSIELRQSDSTLNLFDIPYQPYYYKKSHSTVSESSFVKSQSPDPVID